MSNGSRRSNGESSVFVDKDGVWHGYVTVGTKPDGRPDRRHRRAMTRAKVVAKVKQLERERESGTQAAVGATMTVEQWLVHWLANVAPIRMRRKTLASLKTDIYRHLIPGLGKHRLARVTATQIEVMYGAMARQTVEVNGVVKRRYRPATIDHVHRTLRTALKDAWRVGLIGSNVADKVRRQQDQSVEAADFVVEPFDVEAARRIIETAQRRRNGLRFVLALSHGLRQGEALGLSWSNVRLDGDNPTMWLGQQLQRHTWEHGCGANTTGDGRQCNGRRGADCPKRHGGGLVLTQVKSRRGNRPLTLDTKSVELLRAHQAAQQAERQAASNLWHPSDLVFTQENGKPIDPRADLREWKALLEEAGVREARLHDARHTAATLFLVLGIDQRVVMEMMGWSSAAMVQRYQHVVDAARADAANLMGDLLHEGTAS